MFDGRLVFENNGNIVYLKDICQLDWSDPDVLFVYEKNTSEWKAHYGKYRVDQFTKYSDNSGNPIYDNDKVARVGHEGIQEIGTITQLNDGRWVIAFPDNSSTVKFPHLYQHCKEYIIVGYRIRGE